MSSPAITHAMDEIRTYLVQHPAESLRARALPNKFGVTRATADHALDQLKVTGEVVSCKVIAAGQEDEEFRLATAKMAAFRTICASQEVRRAGSEHIPSKLSRSAPPAAKPSTPAVTIDAPPRFASVYPEIPRFEPTAAKAEPVVEKAPPPCKPVLRARAFGYRQRLIIELIDERGEPLTSTEILKAFHLQGDHAGEKLVLNTCKTLRDRGHLVVCGQKPTGRGPAAMMYATREMAERLASKPATIEAPREAAAPAQDPVEPAIKQVRPTAADVDAIVALVSARAAEVAAQPAKTEQPLERFFRGCDFQWYSLPWLVVCLDGDVPAALEGLAHLVREGRVEYAEVNGRALWHPLPERWA